MMIDNNPIQSDGEASQKPGFFTKFFGGKKGLEDKSHTVQPNSEPDFGYDEEGAQMREKVASAEQARIAEVQAKNAKTKKIALAAGACVLVLGAGAVVGMISAKDDPRQVAEVPDGVDSQGLAVMEQPEQSVELNNEVMHEVQPQTVLGLDPVSAIAVRDGMPNDHWARSLEPLQALAKTATGEAARSMPEYNQDIQGFYITDKLVYGGVGEPYGQLVAEVQRELEMQLGTRIRIEQHQNQKIPALIASPEELSMGAPEIRAIASAAEYAQVTTEARQMAMSIFSQKFNVIRASVPPTPQPAAQTALVTPVVEDTGISDAQRREYNRLQERSNALIEELQTKNKQLLDENSKKDQQMVQLLQMLEDSPKAQTKIKAHMLETRTNMKVQAIQGDLVFLVDKNDKVYVVRVGDPLPEKSNLVISNVDANTGIVYVTER